MIKPRRFIAHTRAVCRASAGIVARAGHRGTIRNHGS